MRIDKFFKLSRIIKRRTEAKEACDNNCVKINDRIAKAGDTIKPTDRIEINFKDKTLEIEVIEVPGGNVSISRAPQLYRVVREEKKDFD